VPATKTFEYKVIDVNGKQVKGRVDAPNETAAVQALRSQGSVPLTIVETGLGLKKDIKIPGIGGKVGLKDLSVFSRQFATMTNSGLSLLRSLAILEDQIENPTFQRAVNQVRLDIEGGLSLSGSLAKHPKIFPALMVAMVRAGETGGFLDDALERIAINFEKDAALRGKVKSALTYPVLVLGFSVLMIAGVLIFQRPLPTQIIVNVSHSLLWLGPLLLIAGFVGTAAVKATLRTNPGFRLWFDRTKLRIPVFGNLFTKIAISRFARNLGTLLSVGVPVMQALDVVGATTGNAVIGNAMVDVQDAVRQGEPMSGPLSQHPVFPQMVTQMVEVGEESGQISEMLNKIADFYDREVDQAAEQLTAAIEPIMVVLMGALVGGMVVCLYLPMFSIYQHIQGANG
jgi:type IV pilus assembly protein PilC